MSTLGQFLKSEREKRGLSLHEIGMSLKINPKILKAIEDNDEPNFPAKTFLRGFIKSYAQYLRLDVDQTLRLFQEEFGSTRPEEPKKIASTTSSNEGTSAPPHGSPRIENSLRRPEDVALPVRSSNRLLTIVGAIVLLLLIAFVAKMMDKYQKESQVIKSEELAVVGDDSLKETPPVDSKTETPPSDIQLATPISGSLTETSTTTTILPTTTLTTTSSSTTIQTTSTTTTSTSTTTTSSTLPKATTTTTLKSVASAPVSSPVQSSSTTTTLAKTKALEVIVEALNKVSIKYSFGTGKTETLELAPDKVHTFRSSGTLILEISDGGAVNLVVNGRDRGVPGTIGKSLKLSFP